MSTDAALEQAKKAIPADIRMYSGCRDEQTSADVSDVASFQLPDPAGRAGGACTSAMLKILYADHQKSGEDLSYQEVLLKIREILQSAGYTQIPQLTASRPLDIKEKFDLVPSSITGTKRAVMIGINYVGHSPGELSGCHNDVLNMKEYIMNVHGFEESNITVLLDDGSHTSPTRDNILAAYKNIVAQSAAGDAVFCHYSGHGGKINDDNGDEKDGYDETLVPLDFQQNGQIRDDDLYKYLACSFRDGVYCTLVMDCCHSGSVMDLPYHFAADGQSDSMTVPTDFDFGKLMGVAQTLMADGDIDAQDMMKLAQSCCNVL